MTRALIVISILLALSLAGNAYLWHSLQAPVDDAAQRALIAELEQRNAADRAALEARHQAELAALNARLESEVKAAQDGRNALKNALAARTAAKVRATVLPSALPAAIADAADLKPDGITAGPEAVTLPADSARAWLNLTLTLRDDMKVCQADCEVKLALQRKAIEPPLVSARQRAEADLLAVAGLIRIKDAEIAGLQRSLRASKADTLQWSLVSAGLGLLAGGVGGVVAVHYAR
jgi:hypothetical protein